MVGHAAVPFPEGSVIAGDIRDVDAVAGALARLVEEAGLGRRVRLAYASERSVIRVVQLPRMPDDEIRSAVGLRLKDFIGSSPADVVWDCALLPTRDEGGQRDVLVATLPRTFAEPVLEAVDRAGLKIVAAEPAALSLVRLVADAASKPAPAANATLVVYLGAFATTIAVLEQDCPRLVRTVGMGGRDLTMAIAKELDMSFADAELLKRDLHNAAPHTGETASLREQAERAMARTMTRLVAEIRGSVQHHGRQKGSLPIGSVQLGGGGSRTGGLGAQIAEIVDVPVYELRLPRSISFKGGLGSSPDGGPGWDPMSFATAIGAAMASVADLVAPLDLSARGEIRTVPRRALAMAGVATVWLGALTAVTVLHSPGGDGGAQGIAVPSPVASSPGGDGGVVAPSTPPAEAPDASGTAPSLPAPAPAPVEWSAVLAGIANVVPDGVVFSSLEARLTEPVAVPDVETGNGQQALGTPSTPTAGAGPADPAAGTTVAPGGASGALPAPLGTVSVVASAARLDDLAAFIDAVASQPRLSMAPPTATDDGLGGYTFTVTINVLAAEPEAASELLGASRIPAGSG